MPSVVTANRLIDGIVVYLATDGGWTEEIGRARIAETEDEIKALEAKPPRRSRRARSSPSTPWTSRSMTARSIHFPCASASAPRTAPR